jgi:hypothetical protein
MINSVAQWFRSKPFAQQLVILAVIFDPIGFIGGYLLAPSFNLDPVIGGAFGIAIASVPTSLHVLNRTVGA